MTNLSPQRVGDWQNGSALSLAKSIALELDPNQASPDSGPCILVTSEELGRFAALAPEGVLVFGIDAVENDAIRLVDAAGRKLKITTTPMLCLGFLAVRESSVHELERARRMLESWSEYRLPALSLIPADSLTGSLSLLLSTSLIDRLQAYTAHVTRLSRELFRLRAAHEDTLNSFAAVESFIGAANVQPCNLTFENAPDGVHTIVDSGAAAITQVLPVSTLGLSVVQLHVQDWKASERPFGGLSVELRSLEDRVTHQTWHVPLDQLEPGWLTLALSGGLAGPQRTPELVIRSLGGLGILPPLSLGALQPLPDFRPRTTNAVGPVVEVAERSLALRTWSGIPGVRPPALDIKPAGSAKVQEIAVPFTLFRDAEVVSTDWRPEFEPVSYLPEARGFLCHPPPSGTTWAEMRAFPIGEQPFRLSVRAMVRSDKAEPIEFAFAFSAGNADQVRERIRASQDVTQQDDLIFSGWQRVTHAEPALLSILVKSAEGTTGSLFFATRVADGRTNAFAWAYFHDLRKTVLGSVTDKPSKPPRARRVVAAAGTSDQDALLEGVPVPLALLEAVENALAPDTSSLPLVKYNHKHRGIFCHPPAAGVTIAQLTGLPARDPFRLLARLHVANEKSGIVEFCMAVTSLAAPEIITRLQAGESVPPDDRFVCSGWLPASYGQDVLLEVDTLPLRGNGAGIFLATRMSRSSTTNHYAWAYFADIRTVSGDHMARQLEAGRA